jgi:hypothetical protein
MPATHLPSPRPLVSIRTDAVSQKAYGVVMALHQPCSKCVDLWRAYGTATRDHVALLNEQTRLAGVDCDRFRQLDSLCEPAAALRDAARIAIETHLAADHGEAAPRVMTA